VYLGIALGVILFGILILAIAKTNPNDMEPASAHSQILGIIWAFSLFLGVPALCSYASALPSPDIAKYEMRIEDTSILFDAYQDKDDKIAIPSHYYVKTSWVNSWNYCETPLIIAIPSSNNRPMIGERYSTHCGDISTTYKELPSPYIEDGTAQCK
jgi:hypothetical protein